MHEYLQVQANLNGNYLQNNVIYQVAVKSVENEEVYVGVTEGPCKKPTHTKYHLYLVNTRKSTYMGN